MNKTTKIPKQTCCTSKHRVSSFIHRGMITSLAMLFAYGNAALTATSMPVSSNELMPIVEEEPIMPSAAKGSVAYLMQAYNIGEAEALRRLELQRLASYMHEWLLEKYPNEYAGMWIDQDNGGILKIASTDPDHTMQLLRTSPQYTSIQSVKAQWSFEQLHDTEKRLETKLNTNSNPKIRTAELAIDVPSNTVNVFQREGMEHSDRRTLNKNLSVAHDHVLAPDAHIEEIIAAENGRAVLKQLVVGKAMDSPVGPSCDPRFCSPPMRGGMRLNVKRNQAAPVEETLPS